MRQLKFLPPIILITFMFSSCTLTKRHFGRGYNVEWNRKLKSESGHPESSKIKEAVADSAIKDIPGSDSVVAEQLKTEAPDVLEKSQLEDYKSSNDPVQSREETVMNKHIEILKIKSVEEPRSTEESKRRLHPLTWGIWGIWSVGIAFIIVLFGGNLYALLIIAGCAFISMIFGIIVIASLRKHPEKYKFRGLSYAFAIPSVVMGSIVVLGAILYALASLGVID